MISPCKSKILCILIMDNIRRYIEDYEFREADY
jgi:hypothetical protein